MSPHDVLASQAIQLKRHLEQYLQEFEPRNGAKALEHLDLAIIQITKFTEEDTQSEDLLKRFSSGAT